MRLDKINPRGPESWDKEKIKAENQALFEEIADIQRILAAEEKHSLLIVLQGMDASGKDGTVRSIFGKVNPAGCVVKAFKKPTEEEFAHDFLWRVHPHAPAKGMIQVFNRSHYEDILVPSVMGYIDKKIIDKRYDQINAFESLLESNGTKILKFYLHVSKDEQLERLTERTTNPEKHWKHNDGDWETREHWDDFMNVYENIFDKCNQPEWIIVPSDRNWVKVHFVAKEILQVLKGFKCKHPELDSERFGNGDSD